MPVIVIVIAQGIVPLLTVVFSGIKSDMAENVIDLDNHTVENRQVVLENDMVEHWRSVYKEEGFLNSNLAGVLRDNNMNMQEFLKSRDMQQQYLEAVFPDMVDTLQYNQTSGIFLVLANGESIQEASAYSGFFLRDSDPQTKTASNTDLLLERGSKKLSHSQSISLDSVWTRDFTFSGAGQRSCDDFFYTPYIAAQENQGIDMVNLGYWSRPFILEIDELHDVIEKLTDAQKQTEGQLLVWIPGEKTEKVLGVADELRREIGNLTNDNYLELNFRAGLSYAANRDIKANEIFDQVRIALTAAKNSGHGDMVYQELPPDNLAYIEPARLCSIDSVARLDQMSLSSIALNLFDRGSEVRVNQVLVNLLSNAAKYSNAGGHVKLTVRETEVDDGSSDIYFEVRDDGIGIPENKQQLIFQRFEQADDSASARKQGTGLGLAISNRLVHMMNSDIKLESQPGVGSIFSFTVKLERVDQDDIVENSHVEIGDFTGRRVLAVEDNMLNMEIIRAILEERGMIVEEAHDGQEAVGIMENVQDGYYDLILMDIMMPVMDGLESARRIRLINREYCRTVPIVAMSANAFDDDVRRSIASGMNGHLSKPVNISKLEEMLSRVWDKAGV